jgi:hypothetical protein
MTVCEQCPACGEPQVLLPAHGRDGGGRLCAACGHAVRTAPDAAVEAWPTLFDAPRGQDNGGAW